MTIYNKPGQHQFPKNFIHCFKWQNVIGLCGAPGGAEENLRWGLDRAPPITKIKGFYKKCYKLVSKENPREAGGGSREEGRKKTKEGPKPSTTSDGIQVGREMWKKVRKVIQSA
jgi:hypothetical protein